MKFEIMGEEGYVEVFKINNANDIDKGKYEISCNGHLEHHGSLVVLSKDKLEELYNAIGELLNK